MLLRYLSIAKYSWRKKQDRAKFLTKTDQYDIYSTARNSIYASEPRAKHTKKNVARKQTIQRHLINNTVQDKH